MVTAGDGSISVGVIGAGYFAGFRHEAWACMDDVAVSSVCDRSIDAACDAASRFKIAGIHTDSAAFFAGGPYDIIDIVTSPETHLDLIHDAVSAPK